MSIAYGGDARFSCQERGFHVTRLIEYHLYTNKRMQIRIRQCCIIIKRPNKKRLRLTLFCLLFFCFFFCLFVFLFVCFCVFFLFLFFCFFVFCFLLLFFFVFFVCFFFVLFFFYFERQPFRFLYYIVLLSRLRLFGSVVF